MKRYAVITFMFDDYDLLREPLVVDNDFDYFCLTNDKNLTSSTWNCIYVEELDSELLTNWQKVYMAKYGFSKYIPDNGYEYWICMDASIKIIGSMMGVIRHFEENGFDIGLSIQPENKSYKDEYYEYKRCGRTTDENIERFREFTLANNIDWEIHTNVIEGTMKVYKNTENVINMLDEMCSIYETACEYKDIDDQCYLTIAFSKYDNVLNTCFFYRQLYHNSNVFEMYEHKTDRKYLREYTEEENTHYLLGKHRALKTF